MLNVIIIWKALSLLSLWTNVWTPDSQKAICQRTFYALSNLSHHQEPKTCRMHPICRKIDTLWWMFLITSAFYKLRQPPTAHKCSENTKTVLGQFYQFCMPILGYPHLLSDINNVYDVVTACSQYVAVSHKSTWLGNLCRMCALFPPGRSWGLVSGCGLTTLWPAAELTACCFLLESKPGNVQSGQQCITKSFSKMLQMP